MISVVALFAVAMLAITLLMGSMKQSTSPVPVTKVPLGITPAAMPAAAERFDSAAVFAERVEPALRQLRENNKRASDRAIARIRGHFAIARDGAPAFAESIIGPLDAVKTTYLAGKGGLLRWWSKDRTRQPVADHVRWNYEQHVTCGPRIKEVILAAIVQLEQDFRASRNEALQTIGSTLRAANLPVSIDIDERMLDAYCQREFEAAIVSINASHVAEKAAIGSASALALSTAATIIADRAIIYALGNAITAAGGSVAGGTTGGAALGSWVPGAGTAIGAGTGLLAGIAVDMWISHKNKRQTINQVNVALEQIENAIVMGDSKHPGMRRILSEAAKRQAEQLASKLKEQLHEAAHEIEAGPKQFPARNG
jgi:hypothetical protein